MTRKRLTITLKSDVLKLLDSVVDGEKIRNRSHAVEYLLSQSLVPKSTRVLVLAGGQGANFRPFTYEIPKAMIPVSGKPLLEHTIENLRSANLPDITISVGHLGEKIKEYFGDGSRWGVRISYLEQKQNVVGTAQPLLEAQKEFSDETFLLMYGDVLAEINLLELLAFHRSQHGVAITMALASVDRVTMWGVAKVVGNKVVAFEEKPEEPHTRSHLINAGIYVMEPNIFKYIGKTASRLESDVFPRLAEEGKIAGYPFEGQWYDVSTPQIYEEVILQWKRK
jgi:NDP-sugar pyrophosphorylase family protein